MAITYDRGIGIGWTNVMEDGKNVGHIVQNQVGKMIRREIECKTHAWSDVIFWGPSEEFPGDKDPKHFEKFHGEGNVTVVGAETLVYIFPENDERVDQQLLVCIGANLDAFKAKVPIARLWGILKTLEKDVEGFEVVDCRSPEQWTRGDMPTINIIPNTEKGDEK